MNSSVEQEIIRAVEVTFMEKVPVWQAALPAGYELLYEVKPYHWAMVEPSGRRTELDIRPARFPWWNA